MQNRANSERRGFSLPLYENPDQVINPSARFDMYQKAARWGETQQTQQTEQQSNLDIIRDEDTEWLDNFRF